MQEVTYLKKFTTQSEISLFEINPSPSKSIFFSISFNLFFASWAESLEKSSLASMEPKNIQFELRVLVDIGFNILAILNY